MPITVDADLLTAALAGYQQKRKELDDRMAELRRRLGGESASSAAHTGVRRERTLSRDARKRIAAAQRRRWAAVRKAKQQPASPPVSRKTARTAAPARQTAAPARKKIASKGSGAQSSPAVAQAAVSE